MWGLRPRDPATDRATINIRSEGRRFESHRCLVPASEFFFRDPSGRGRWRFTMGDSDSFYFAGIWRPAGEGWPEAYAALTTAANPDIEQCNNRQMAVIPRGAHMDWLDHRVPEEEILKPLPAGTFRRERVR